MGRLAAADTVSRTLDKTLVIQILGYFLASVMAVVLVHKVQAGDWGSLGIRRSVDTASEVLRGLAFGTVLIGIWLPISLLLTKGRLATDPMVRALVGETSGPGLVLAAFVLVVGAPFIEEIYYRGMLYEKLRRRSRLLAIIVTSVLFVAAHGALIIPALMLLAFGLAWKRETKSIWYTMAAHGAWNFVVLCLGAFIVFSPATTFSPGDGAYSFRHPASWERVGELERPGAGGVGIDVAFRSSDGSAVIVGRLPLPARASARRFGSALRNVPGLPPGTTMSEGSGPRRPISGAPAYEIRVNVPNPVSGASVDSRVVIVTPHGMESAIMFDVTCPPVACDDAHKDFEQLLSTVRFES